VEELIRSLLTELGEDPGRDGLIDTPKRVAAAYRFLTSGYKKNIDEVINGAIFECEANHMIIVKDIEFYSLCEHHMLPFYGCCHIGYIPRGRVLGVSKLARVTEIFSRRLQIQERLTNQIARLIMDTVKPEGVGVVVEAKHLCMMMRGVEKQDSAMITSAMLGSFHSSDATRNEFLQLIARGDK